MVLDALRGAPLFAALSDADLERLAGMVERQHLDAGELLLREGDPGDAMFIVVGGELEVTKRTGTTELPIARVGPGAIQGEIAAIEGRKRAASVRALTEVEVIRIPRQALLALLDAGPGAALALLRTALERARGLESFARQEGGADLLDWKPTRSYEAEVQLEADDVQQMLDAPEWNRRRRQEHTGTDSGGARHEDRRGSGAPSARPRPVHRRLGDWLGH